MSGLVLIKHEKDSDFWRLKKDWYEIIDGCYVAAEHVNLYSQILKKFGHLYQQHQLTIPVPEVTLHISTAMLDVISEIMDDNVIISSSMLLNYRLKVDYATENGFSVHWLQNMIQEMIIAVDGCQVVKVVEAAAAAAQFSKELVKRKRELAKKKYISTAGVTSLEYLVRMGFESKNELLKTKLEDEALGKEVQQMELSLLVSRDKEKAANEEMNLSLKQAVKPIIQRWFD